MIYTTIYVTTGYITRYRTTRNTTRHVRIGYIGRIARRVIRSGTRTSTRIIIIMNITRTSAAAPTVITRTIYRRTYHVGRGTTRTIEG